MGVLADMGGEHLEMMIFAEKRREVSGQRIDELLPLFLVLLQVAEVISKAAQAQTPQPACQAAVDHLVLGRRQINTRLLIEQTPDALKVPRRVLKLPQFLTWCAPRRPTQNSSHSSSLGLLGRGRLLLGALARGALGAGARGAFSRGATGFGAALATPSNLNTATACDSTEA